MIFQLRFERRTDRAGGAERRGQDHAVALLIRAGSRAGAVLSDESLRIGYLDSAGVVGISLWDELLTAFTAFATPRSELAELPSNGGYPTQ